MNTLATHLIRLAESLRIFVYDDATGEPIKPGSVVKGHPTIGYGRALDVDGITEDEAIYLETNSQHEIEYVLGAYHWWSSLNEARQAVLIDMAYNMGTTELFHFVEMIKALERGDWNGASDAMLQSEWAREVPIRAQRDAKIMRDGTI